MISSKVDLALQVLRHMGPGWLTHRFAYELRKRSGLLRLSVPSRRWEDISPSEYLLQEESADPGNWAQRPHPPFFFEPSNFREYSKLVSGWDDADSNPVVRAARLLEGELEYFEHLTVEASWPPAWSQNPFDGQQVHADRHWTDISDFGNGDIKILWEPSRFGFSYLLVRAYWRTQDNSYAEAFWQAVEDWRQCNPPQLGVQWKCGQEVSLRLMAWCFGLYGFRNSSASTPEREAQLLQMIAVSAARIASNLGYALSQSNNHGVSEAAGLLTAGMLFPECRNAQKWRAMGRHQLERQARTLIYADGSFSQHSHNYHRMMLQVFLWAARLCEIHRDPLSDTLLERIRLAGEYLYQVHDSQTGKVPCYGGNDGALALPLTSCDYSDFRPTIQTAQLFASSSRCFKSGPWDENAFWLLGSSALDSPLRQDKPQNLSASAGGYYTLRTTNGFLFTRAPKFSHRPSQADALHADIWWRGQNIAIDPGTYSYNAPAPWNGALAETEHHNTVTVDGLDQMNRVSRFLWMPWLNACVYRQATSAEGQLDYWEGGHDGYLRLPDPVTHRRGILRLGDEHWLILDRLCGREPHRYRLHWLLLDCPYQYDAATSSMVLETAAGDYQMQAGANFSSSPSLARAQDDSPRGWCSPYYLDKKPALSFALSTQPVEHVTYWTLFGPAGFRCAVSGQELKVESENFSASVQIASDDQLLTSVTYQGVTPDNMVF